MGTMADPKSLEAPPPPEHKTPNIPEKRLWLEFVDRSRISVDVSVDSSDSTQYTTGRCALPRSPPSIV
jgi:hypothetical protein